MITATRGGSVEVDEGGEQQPATRRYRVTNGSERAGGPSVTILRMEVRAAAIRAVRAPSNWIGTFVAHHREWGMRVYHVEWRALRSRDQLFAGVPAGESLGGFELELGPGSPLTLTRYELHFSDGKSVGSS